MYDVIVVGGGIVGVSTAYSLLQAGASVLLIDRNDHGRATDAGAGIVSPIPYNGEKSPVFAMFNDAFRHYDTLISDLESHGVGDTGFARCGKLIVAASRDEMDDFAETREAIMGYKARYGDSGDLRETTSDEARALFPPLNDVMGAIYYNKAARVDGRLLCLALKRRSRKIGLLAQNDSVSDLVMDNGRVIGVKASRETIEAEQVVIAGGAWTSQLGDQVGLKIPVEPQRGQICHLGVNEGQTTSEWPIVTAFHDHYMVPWPDNRVVVGATRECGVGFSANPTAAGLNEALTEALRIAPGLAAAEIREIRVGLRPLTQDGNPVIGPAPGISGLYLVTGHGPSGLHLGPYSGKLAADALQGRKLDTDISMFAPDRFI